MKKRARYQGKNLDIIKTGKVYIGYYNQDCVACFENELDVIKAFNRLIYPDKIDRRKFRRMKNG